MKKNRFRPSIERLESIISLSDATTMMEPRPLPPDDGNLPGSDPNIADTIVWQVDTTEPDWSQQPDWDEGASWGTTNN